MKRSRLKTLGVPDEAVSDVLDAIHEAVKSAEITVSNKLSSEIETLKAGLETAKEEITSHKNKYEAEVKAREEAEGRYKAEKEAHEAAVTTYKTEKADAAKNDAFIKAVTGYEHAEKGKLNPKQAGLLMAALGSKAEFTEKDGVYSVKNLDVIMDEAVSHGGFDFAKAETRTAQTGFFSSAVSSTAQNKASGRSMNDFIRAGANGQIIGMD